jgi:hypothetical protein
LSATNFDGASTTATAVVGSSDSVGVADADGSADCDAEGAGAASSLSLLEDCDQTIIASAAIPITTNHAVRADVDCFGAATGLAGAGATDFTGAGAATGFGADVTATAAFFTTRFAGAFYSFLSNRLLCGLLLRYSFLSDRFFSNSLLSW